MPEKREQPSAPCGITWTKDSSKRRIAARGGVYLFESEAAETVFYIQKLKDAGLALKDIKAMYRARHDSETGHEGHSKVIAQLEAH